VTFVAIEMGLAVNMVHPIEGPPVILEPTWEGYARQPYPALGGDATFDVPDARVIGHVWLRNADAPWWHWRRWIPVRRAITTQGAWTIYASVTFVANAPMAYHPLRGPDGAWRPRTVTNGDRLIVRNNIKAPV
jgi:hypothetical protein